MTQNKEKNKPRKNKMWPKKQRYEPGTKIINKKPLKTTKNTLIPPGNTGIIGKTQRAYNIQAVKYRAYFTNYGQVNRIKHFQITKKIQ